MIEFGKTLREAREAKGYSVSQLAEITHILPQIIENLEKEDFTRIVAPIYGRGFVKLYCETVGLDAQPLVAEFMEIYNGNRQPAIRLKEVEAEDPAPAPQPPVEEPPAAPEPQNEPPKAIPEPPAEIPQPDPEPIVEEPPLFNFDEQPNRSASMEEPPAFEHPALQPFAPGPDDLPFRDEPAEPKRDYRLPGYSMPDVPRRFWRFGILVAGAVVIVILLVLCSRALYRATMQVPETSEEVKEASVTAKPETQNSQPKKLNPKPSAPRAARKGVAVPPLYID